MMRATCITMNLNLHSTALSLLFLSAATLSGAVIHVAPQPSGSGNGSSWADAATLEDALQISNEGDTLWLLGGTYLPTGGVVGNPSPAEVALRWIIDRNVRLIGGFDGTESAPEERWAGGITNPAVLSGDIDGNDTQLGSILGDYTDIVGQNSNGLLLIEGDVAVYLEAVTFTASSGQPAVDVLSGGASLELVAVNFRGNLGGEAENAAGGLVFRGEELLITESGFYGNRAPQGAGAVSFLPIADGAAFTGVDVTAMNNSGLHGAILGWADQFTIRMTDSLLQDNEASGNGGALAALSDAATIRDRILMEDTDLYGNTALINGGGIFAVGAQLDIVGGEFRDNEALAGAGGAVYLDSASLISSDVLLRENSALGGGAIRVGDPHPSRPYHLIQNCLLFDNSAALGGALYGGPQTAGDLNVLSSTFSTNRADTGGAWYGESGYPATFISCLFSNNAATNEGGAFYQQGVDANLSFHHVSFLGNGASAFGTGTDTATGLRTEITNSLLWGNLSGGAKGSGLPAGMAVSHSLVELGYAGGTAIEGANPLLFHEPGPGPDGVVGTSDDLISTGATLAASPVIDAATGPLPTDRFDVDGDGLVTDPFPYDDQGHAREGGSGRDMGAREQWEFKYTLHVDALASPGGDGRNWSTAFQELTSAFAMAGDGTTILVAEGTYQHALSATDPEAAFLLAPDVSVIGGFPNLPGDSFDMNDADPLAFPVILEGFAGELVPWDQRTLNLFRQSGPRAANHPRASAPSLNFLKGLTLQKVRGSAIRGAPGGAGLSLVACVFRELQGFNFLSFGQSLNSADFQPGAVWVWDTGLTLTSCQFIDCGSFLDSFSPVAGTVVFAHGPVPVSITDTEWWSCGGGDTFGVLRVAGGAQLSLTRSDFLSCRGRVMETVDVDLSVVDSRILGTDTLNGTSAVRLIGSSSDWYQVAFGGTAAAQMPLTPVDDKALLKIESGTLHRFTQSTFYGYGNPLAGPVGGTPFTANGGHQPLIYTTDSTVELANCLVHHRDTVLFAADYDGVVSVRDSIVWSDHGAFSDIGVTRGNGQVTTLATSITDPLLSHPAGDDGVLGTLDDLPVPNIGSPALDSANVSFVDIQRNEDVRGQPRNVDAALGSNPLPDVGAYEFQGGVLVANTGLTVQPGMAVPITGEMLRVELPVSPETAVFTILNSVPDELPGGRLVNTLTENAVTTFTLAEVLDGRLRFEAFHRDAHPVGSTGLSFRVSQPGYPDRIAFAFPVSLAQLPVIHVTENGHGSGLSWQDPASLQDALVHIAPTYAPGAVEIRVAMGSYIPDPAGADRQMAFEIGPHIHLRGGYRGSGENPDQRDFRRYASYLSGDLQRDDAAHPAVDPSLDLAGDNSRTVVRVLPGSGRSTLIDGFIICNGLADNPIGGSNDSGAGMFINAASPTLQNLIFAGNHAWDEGGALRLLSSAPTGQNLLFRHNMAVNGGGAISALDSRPRFSRVHFERNGSDTGGAVLIQGASSRPAFTACRFVDNHARRGGALALFEAEALVASTLFMDNSADFGGAVWIDGAFQPRFHFVTADGNEANGPGAVAYLKNGAQPEFLFSVLWDNGAAVDAPSGSGLFQIGSDGLSMATVIDSVVAGGYPNGSGAVDQDPMMRRLNGPDWIPGTLDDLVVPRPDSWLVDVISAWPTLDWADADGDLDTSEALPAALRDGNGRAEVGTLPNAQQALAAEAGYVPAVAPLADWGAHEFSGYGRWMLEVAEANSYGLDWQGYLVEPASDADRDGSDNYREYSLGMDPLSAVISGPSLVPVSLSPAAFELVARLPAFHDDHDYQWQWTGSSLLWEELTAPTGVEAVLEPWHTMDSPQGRVDHRLRLISLPADRFLLQLVAE